MSRYINSVPQILNENGDPIVGAKKYLFEPASSTLKTIYSDSALTLATANPVVSDSAGRFPSFFLDGTYKETQEDNNGVTLWTRDPVGEDTAGQWEAWDSGTTYSINEIVLGSDGEFYISLTDSNISNNPTSSPTNWEQISLGKVWNTNITYALGDTVYGSDGYLYISQINSNVANDPTTDHVNWWPGSPEHISVTASGTDTYTATYGETAYKTGWPYYITFTNANTSTTPTLNLDSLGAKTIKKNGGLALVPDDIPAGHEAILRYDGTDLILLNPSVIYRYIQRVDATPYTTYASASTVIPEDDTIPQSTEGTEFITVTITPTNASNILIIRADASDVRISGAVETIVAALFQDSTAGALKTTSVANPDVSLVTLVHRMVAGTTSSTTFKLRIGPGATKTIYINGDNATRLFGGTSSITMSVEEYKV